MKDVWHEHNTQKEVAGDNTVALVSPLKPATSYHFRVLAENHLGTSAPSDILHVSIKHNQACLVRGKSLVILSRELSVRFASACALRALRSLTNAFLRPLVPVYPTTSPTVTTTGPNRRRDTQWTAEARHRGAHRTAASEGHLATAGSIPLERRTSRIHHQLRQSRVSLSAYGCLE